MRKFLTLQVVIPAAVFVMIFMIALRQSSTLDPDLWWHLQTAKDIVATKSIPHVDNYSFTKSGSEWITHEWLSELLLYGIYNVSGLGGLVFIFAGIITATFLIVYQRSAGRPYVAAFAVLLAALAATPLFGIRVQMITLLFASIYIALLERFSRDGQTRILWWLPPLMLLWVNVHAGFALGLGLIGLYFLRVAFDRKWKLLWPLAVIGIVCFLVVPVNPNGLRIILYPLQTLRSPSMAALIDEWSSPDFHQPMFLAFAALLLLTFAVLAFAPKRPRSGDFFLLVFTAFGALRSSRHIPIFTLIAAPILARHLWDLIKSHGWDHSFVVDTRPTTGKLFTRFILLALPVSLAVFQFWHFVSHQEDYVIQRNPVAAVDFIQTQKLPGPIFNRYGWGGYLIFKLYPNYRVYADGRADVYGDDFLFQMINTYDGGNGWRQPLDQYGVRTVLISPDVPLASLLRNDPAWQKIYEDNQAVIFTRAN